MDKAKCWSQNSGDEDLIPFSPKGFTFEQIHLQRSALFSGLLVIGIPILLLGKKLCKALGKTT